MSKVYDLMGQPSILLITQFNNSSIWSIIMMKLKCKYI